MSVIFEMITIDLAVGLYKLENFLSSEKKKFPERLNKVFGLIKPTPELLVSKYVDVYTKCIKLSKESEKQKGPYLGISQVRGENTRFSVLLCEPVIDRRDILFNRDTYRVCGQDELVQLNMTNRHTAVRLTHYVTQLEELANKIKLAMPKTLLLDSDHAKVTPLFTVQAVEPQSGVENLINSLAESVPFQNKEIAEYLNTKGDMQLSRIQIGNTLYSMINYNIDGNMESLLVSHDLDTHSEKHTKLKGYQCLSTCNKDMNHSYIISINDNSPLRIGDGVIHDTRGVVPQGLGM